MKTTSFPKQSQDGPNQQPVALVTGATRGIGKAIASKLSELGYNLILTGTNAEEIFQLNDSCSGTIKYLAADFSQVSSIEAFTDHLNTVDRLDVCINCAGINIIKPINEVTLDDLQKILNINYIAAYEICKSTSNIMKKNSGGRIVNIASIWSVVSKKNRSLYSGSKAALTGMTRALAIELAPHNILVNCVSPGFVLTDLTRDSLTDSQLNEVAQLIPMKRLATPDEIANFVAFLAGSDNSYITGQNIVIDGGYTVA